MTASTDELVIRREGRAGRITLNRPKALNALSYPTVQGMVAALQGWCDDPATGLVVIDGAGERGLCAGGDVRALYDRRAEGSGYAWRFWHDEYQLNAMIRRYPKPIVAIQDGIVMGGGIGISGHASHRIVTERSQLAMPETTIGLIPDVGGTWLLAQAPGSLGPYLALTSARMNAGDAIAAGFSDAFVASDRLAALIAALAETGDATATIAAHSAPAPVGALAAHRTAIDRAFARETVEGVIAALQSEGSEWAAATLAELKPKSPKSMKVTLAAVRGARALPSLEAALAVELRLTTRLFEDGEFLEGVRALLVDKDRQPKWRPPTLAEVTPAMVAAFFAPLDADRELSF